MSRAADFGLCLAKKHRRDTGPTGRSVYEDLLHLVVLGDNESYNLAVRFGHPHAFEPVSRAGYELLLAPMAEEFRRDVPDVAIKPPEMPDPGNDGDIVGRCLAKRTGVGRRRQF
jgi:hypothetical protein